MLHVFLPFLALCHQIQRSYAVVCDQQECIATNREYIDDIMSRTDWTEDSSATFLREFHSTELGKCIKNIKTEMSGNTTITRPDPSCYFPKTVIDYHLRPFTSSGAAHIGTAYWIAAGDFATVEHNGIVWVAPYYAMVTMLEDCVNEADGNATSAAVCTLRELGESTGSSDMFHSPSYNASNRVILVEVCNTKVHDLNIRIPSGNEPGASDQWIPGGYTSGGMREAILDVVPQTDYCWHAVSDTDGAFCYHMNGGCDIECNQEDTERKEDCSATSCSEASCANANNDDNNSGTHSASKWMNLDEKDWLLIALGSLNVIGVMTCIVCYVRIKCPGSMRRSLRLPSLRPIALLDEGSMEEHVQQQYVE